jgi:hypothetical protein
MALATRFLGELTAEKNKAIAALLNDSSSEEIAFGVSFNAGSLTKCRKETECDVIFGTLSANGRRYKFEHDLPMWISACGWPVSKRWTCSRNLSRGKEVG